MNTFKSFSLLLLGFVFAAFPLSNQGFCNGELEINTLEAFLGCPVTITSTTLSGDCSGSTYSVTVVVSAANADAVTVQITASGFDSGAVAATDNMDGTFSATISMIPKDETLTVTAVGTGVNCSGAGDETDVDMVSALCTSCDTCIADGGKIANVPTNAAGEEICDSGPNPESFFGEGTLNVNGMISSPRIVNIMALTAVNLNALFEVKLGAEVTITTGAGCVVFAPENPDNALVANTNINVNTPIKITPNPLTNWATIDYNLAKEGNVQIYAFNLKGERVAILVDDYRIAGQHQIEFNAADLAEGFYYLTVRTANGQTTEKMVIVR